MADEKGPVFYLNRSLTLVGNWHWRFTGNQLEEFQIKIRLLIIATLFFVGVLYASFSSLDSDFDGRLLDSKTATHLSKLLRQADIGNFADD